MTKIVQILSGLFFCAISIRVAILFNAKLAEIRKVIIGYMHSCSHSLCYITVLDFVKGGAGYTNKDNINEFINWYRFNLDTGYKTVIIVFIGFSRSTGHRKQMEKKMRIARDGRSVDVATYRSATIPAPKGLAVSVSHYGNDSRQPGNRIQLHVVEIGPNFTSFVMFDDVNFPSKSFLMDSATRFNAKRMMAIANDETAIKNCIARFCEAKGLVNDWS
jgi:hypothetical protein